VHDLAHAEHGDPAHVEPASFGDSLFQVEQLMHDVVQECGLNWLTAP
jgi:hypothetical protein